MREHDPAFEARFLAAYDRAKILSASLAGPSLAERLVGSSRADRERILASLTRPERAALLSMWRFWARPKQIIPDIPHRVVLLMGGRGWGKNRAGAERVRERIAQGARRILIAGATHRETLRYMVGGQGSGSGLLDVLSPAERAGVHVKEQKGEIVFASGAVVHLVSDETPELRGGAYEVAWLDEIAKWRHLTKLWQNLEFCMRVRSEIAPEVIVTTTPRPMRFLKELVADRDTITILGASDENATNLDRHFLDRLDRRFGGSRVARQERGGELLEELEGALFSQSTIDATRVAEAPAMVRVVVAIDPAIATSRDNDETGIVCAGIDRNGHVYVLGDASGRLGPEAWGAAALRLYEQHRADAFVGERNRGGDLVAANMRATIREARGRNATAKIVDVLATRGKQVRAEPVATLAEQGRLHFVGVHPELETELTEWAPALGGASPNRLDALVWSVYELARFADPTEPARDRKAEFGALVKLQAGVVASDPDARRMPSGRGVDWTRLLGGTPGSGRL
jgi:phage terminase large subunit-like protein